MAQAQRAQKRPTVRDIKDTNWLVDQAKKYHDEGIVLRRIPFEDMVVVGFHDAAWANVDVEGEQDPEAEMWRGNFKLASQLGTLLVLADRKCLENLEGPMSLIEWRSKASSRVCRSTFAGETMACAEAAEGCIYARSLLLTFLHGRLVGSDEAGSFMEYHLVTDCKSLFDHIHREGVPKPPSEKRLALDLAGIRQALREEAQHQWDRRYGRGNPVRPDRPLRAPLHWLTTDRQLADILTKRMRGNVWWDQVRGGRLQLPFRAMQNQ